MSFEVLPLLDIQRQLLEQPRDLARFQAYLKTLLNDQGDGIAVPINAFNPMAKEPIKVILDDLVALDAEGILRAAAVEVNIQFPGERAFKTGWVVADDLQGTWTHRPTGELKRWRGKDYELEHGFCTVTWWSSQGRPTEVALRQQAAGQLYALAYCSSKGPQPTLGHLYELFSRRGHFSGLSQPPPIPPALANATDDATLIAALYGDAEAAKLGYPPLGLLP